MNHVDRGDQLRAYTTYDHRFRRGSWQVLVWSFLLKVGLANSYILQLKTPCPNWKKYIYNAIFINYAQESRARKRGRSGKEEDINDLETWQKHLQRDINHIWRGSCSNYLACLGFRRAEIRPFKKRRYLEALSGNEERKAPTRH